MEQKDYLLREIEKIGMVLRAILNKLFAVKGNLSITIENEFEQTNELLLSETGFDLKHFLTLDESALEEYISRFKGMNAANLELLAGIIANLGDNDNSADNKHILEKALQVYMLCEKTDKTFSFERQNKIEAIKAKLQS